MSEEVRQRKVRIGDLLVQAGLISELQLQQALQEQKRTGSKLGRAVIDMGLVSEAGMPAVADPGSSVVRAAHQLGIEVLPLTGPVSLLLALAASGLNGQNFAFTGYLPQDAIARTTQIQQISRAVQQSGQTRIVIETPYRNQVLLEALLSGLDGQLRLCVASGLTLPDADGARSASVAEWRQARWAVTPKAPAVFLIGR